MYEILLCSKEVEGGEEEMKQKYIIIILIVLALTGGVYLLYTSPLESKELKNIYNFTDDEFLVYSLMEKVAAEMQFVPNAFYFTLSNSFKQSP